MSIIASYAEIQATIEIHAAPTLVWQTFQQIEAWPHWYPGVLAATWRNDQPWMPQSRMHLQVRNSLRLPMDSIATVLPTSDGTLIWANRAMGLVTVCRASVCVLGNGAQLTLHKSYGGPTAILLRALKGRQQQMLRQGLENLRQRIAFNPNKL